MMSRIIFIFMNIFVVVVLSKGNSIQQRIEKSWKGRKLQCERTTCNMYNIDEGMNCINKCLSPTCYDTVYGDNPLEDGEIDSPRNRVFQNCVRQEFRKVLVDGRHKRTNKGTGL